MLSGTSFIVTFNLRSKIHGDAVPIVYGSIKELGGGEPSQGISMSEVDGDYNYKADVVFMQPIDANEVWYSYCFRPSFGSLIPESVPRRFMPRLEAHANLYDTIDQVTSIGDLLIHFHVRCYTEFGQNLYLSGNIPQLGEWDPDSAIQLFYEGNKDYWTCNVRFPLSAKSRKIEYKYFRSFGGERTEWEPDQNHKIVLGPVTSPAVIELADTFRWKDKTLIALTRAPFVDVINNRADIDTMKPSKIFPNEARPGFVNTRFNVLCPNVRRHQKLLLLGSAPELGNWRLEKAIELNGHDFPHWTADVVFPRSSLPFEYKFIVVGEEEEDVEVEVNDNGENNNSDAIDVTKNKEKQKKVIIQRKVMLKEYWESENNRFCPGITSKIVGDFYPATMIVSNWFVNPNPKMFKGVGICCPLFSLRSKDSCGIGQYSDIKDLVDFCNLTGATMIKLLPVFDTTNKGDWPDSNPFCPISCFALHPIYINLLTVLESLPSDIYNDIQNTKWKFEQKFVVDYPTVYKYKIATLRQIYDRISKSLDDDIDFSRFVDHEGEWLRPYALFCYFRDKYQTVNIESWPEYSTISKRQINSLCAKHYEELQFTYWVQYICDKQFKDAKKYALSHGVVLKSDFLVNVNFNSVDYWSSPQNFRAGKAGCSPPTFDAKDIYQESFQMPTLDWEYMENDEYEWLENRLKRMNDFFQAITIKGILSVFREWEIPHENCVRNVLGQYFPSLPLTTTDLNKWGLFDIKRYSKPYIRRHIIQDKFGEYEARSIIDKFFDGEGFDPHDDHYSFKKNCNTERKIIKVVNESFGNFDSRRKSEYIHHLFDLLAGVTLIPDNDRRGCFHVRSHVSLENANKESPAWLELPEPQRIRMKELGDGYAIRQHYNLWISEASKKLNIFEDKASNMLLFAEDTHELNEIGKLGQEAINLSREAGFIPLHIGTVPSSETYLFSHSTSTHEMPSLRGWWEENNERAKDFWYSQLHKSTEPPYSCDSKLLEEILRFNMNSEVMWTLFPLQDFAALNQNFRRQSPEEERICDPSDPNHHWRYRYPYSIAELVQCNDLTNQIREMIFECHRL